MEKDEGKHRMWWFFHEYINCIKPQRKRVNNGSGGGTILMIEYSQEREYMKGDNN